MSLRDNWLAANPVEREAMVIAAVKNRNVPSWVLPKNFVPVRIKGLGHELVVWFMGDFLAVGPDAAPLYLPCQPSTLQVCATELDCYMLTTKLTQIAFQAADQKLSMLIPSPKADIESAAFMLKASDLYNKKIDRSKRLRAGHSKTIVMGPGLSGSHLAIFGAYAEGVLPKKDAKGNPVWYNASNQKGKPDCWAVQSYPGPHISTYMDYSQHGQLVAKQAKLDGKMIDLGTVFRDKTLSALVSTQGPLEPYYPNAGPGSGTASPPKGALTPALFTEDAPPGETASGRYRVPRTDLEDSGTVFFWSMLMSIGRALVGA